MAESRSGASARPTAVTAGRPASSRWRRTSNSARRDAERLFLQGVGPAVDDEEPDEVARRPDRQVAELRATPTASPRAADPTGGQQGPGAVAQPEPRERARRPASARSELLAQVGGHRRVVAERLVQVARVGPVVAGRQLDERRAHARRPIRSASPMSCAPDAALARAGVHDEGEDPDDRVAVLEPRQGVDAR